MSNLAAVCTDCHTPKNHKEGGKLYNLEPELQSSKGATFMTMVRWDMLNKLKDMASDIEVYTTYGVITKQARKTLHIAKSHANDAYCMGEFHPRHRARTVQYQKRRHNNRILNRFYDATYLDVRDRRIKKGAQIGCNRTNRKEPRNSPKNERIYREHKVSKGRISTRTKRYIIQSGDIILYENKKYVSGGVVNYGRYVSLRGLKKQPSVKKVKVLYHGNGWIKS